MTAIFEKLSPGLGMAGVNTLGISMGIFLMSEAHE
jgi:hypothetical protein